MTDDDGAAGPEETVRRRTLLRSGVAVGAISMSAGCGFGSSDDGPSRREPTTTPHADPTTAITDRTTTASEKPPTTRPPPEGTGDRYYVSTAGNDDWNGQQPSPGDDGTGPFRTLEAARDAIRRRSETDGLPEGGVTVALRGGEYRRPTRSFALDERDSGTEDAPIVYRAYEDEDVRIVGGRHLDGDDFAPVSDASVRDRLPPASRHEVVEYDLAANGITEYGTIVTTGLNLPRDPPTPELFVDGQTMQLARWPNEGWTTVGDVHDPGARPRDIKEHFTERPLPPAFDDGATFEYTDDRPEGWADYEDVWMQGYWWNFYATSNLEIESFDPGGGTITTDQAHLYSVRAGQRYYYYNVLDELDVPGEFYIDRETGMLYLYPPYDVGAAAVELSLLADPLVAMDGVANVAFRGIEFAVSRGSAVAMVDCTRCEVRGCDVTKMGAMGVVLGDSIDATVGGINGGRENAVIDCEIEGTGLGGIKLGGGDRRTLEPGNNVVVGNEIHGFSRVQPTYTPAVWPVGVGSRIADNHIYDSPHVGILIGGNEHTIEFNDIHHVVRETSDAGAIYMGRDWSELGNTIRHNYIHHLHNEFADGQYAVYLDDLACGTQVAGNVFHRVPEVASIGGGRHNSLVNNVLVDCDASVSLDARGLDPDWPHCRRESEGGSGVLFRRLESVPYTDDPWASRYPWLPGLPEDAPCTPKANTVACNLIVDTPEPSIAFAARETGRIEDNLVTEGRVGFVNREAERFRLAADSTVFDELPCFENVPFTEMKVEANRPDYVIEGADVVIARVDDGRHRIAVTVHNQGRAPAPATEVRATYDDTGAPIGSATTAEIPAGRAEEVTIEWDTSGHAIGSRQEVRVVVDDERVVGELIEDNNSVTRRVTLPVYAVDLAIGPVAGTVVSDGRIELAVPVTNRGPGTTDSTTVGVRDVTAGGEETIATLELPALGPDERTTLTHEWAVDLGPDETRTVEAIANPNDAFPERSDANNTSPTTHLSGLDPFSESYRTTASTPAQFGRNADGLVIDAAGVDIWEDADQYGAAFRPDVSTTSDTTATVKVTSLEAANEWSKAGVMMRNDATAAGESTGYAAVMVTPDNGFEFEWDSDANGFVDSAANSGTAITPSWVRLERSDRTFTASYSLDGETWQPIGSTTVMGVADTQDVAFFATSHAGDVQGTAAFEDFEVTNGE